MFTYAIYNFILFGSTLSAYLYEKAQNKNAKMVFLLVSFLIPFVFLAIRYNIGTDYHHYVDYFYKIKSGYFVAKEPGYIIINKIIAFFNMDVQWLFIIFGFVTMLFIYKTLPKEGFAIGVFLFIVMFYLYQGYSVIRQGLALSIMAYAIKFIYEKNFKYYLAWSVVAMMFHVATGFILLAFYPFANKKFNKYFLISLIIIFFILVKYTSLYELMLKFATVIFPKYAWYLNSEFMKPSNSPSTGLGVMFKVGIAILVIFSKDKIEKKFPYANITINYYVFYIIFYIFSMKLMMFFRVEQIFLMGSILSLTYFLNTFTGWSKVVVVYFILGVLFVFYIKYINYGTIASQDVLINPYKTILERK